MAVINKQHHPYNFQKHNNNNKINNNLNDNSCTKTKSKNKNKGTEDPEVVPGPKRHVRTCQSRGITEPISIYTSWWSISEPPVS